MFPQVSSAAEADDPVTTGVAAITMRGRLLGPRFRGDDSELEQ
jgi:hypothetical protein